MLHSFREIWTRRIARGKCRECGKALTRSKTFTHTVNPWNKTAAGDVKTSEEVWADVRAEADEWQPDFRCKTHVG